MQLDRGDNRDAVYKLLIGCVVPRPIAGVSTVDAAGVNSLAPFSSSCKLRSDSSPEGEPIVATFDMPHASSDGGAVLLSGNTQALIGSGPQWAWALLLFTYRC